MQLFSLASSSSGNCYIYEFENANIVVDIGISFKEFKIKLQEINKSFDDLKALFITHEHTDHIKGLKQFIKHTDIPIYTNLKTAQKLEIENHIEFKDSLKIANFNLEKLHTSHDAVAPFGLKIAAGLKNHIHITDSGYIPEQIIANTQNATSYLIESNYEEEVLITSTKYPFSVKKRILADGGHLSNRQCRLYLERVIDEKTKTICLAHLSENNNNHELVKQQFDDLNQDVVILEKSNIVEVKL